MIFRTIFLFIMFSGVAWAESEKMKITFSPASDGGGNVYEIDISIASSLPHWNFAVDEPPLSVQSVLGIARKELLGEAHKSPMKLASVRLSSASVVDKTVVWYYSVTFINDAKYIKDAFVEKTINVLMDGSVIKPRKISKEEYEQWFK
jgi:hypothetical protein